MVTNYNFSFGNYNSQVSITDDLPLITEIANGELKGSSAVIICDTNTENFAHEITAGHDKPILVLESGESSKNWNSVEKILSFGLNTGLGRDGFFIGIGGGVICDLTAFAASIYMRGANLALFSTSLLSMIDASLGGKTGIDLFGLKNMAGTFYPASFVILPLAALDFLPEKEWKSGMAELIKTAILDSEDFFELVKKLIKLESGGRSSPEYRKCLTECLSKAVMFKGKIVAEDPKETKNKRVLLNLGHTFGHALETALGLGAISHGEAVAWGIARACELGIALGITPIERAREIIGLLLAYGFKTNAPHPMLNSYRMFRKAMKNDKKTAGGKIQFIVPSMERVQIIEADDDTINKTINGEFSLDAL